MQTIDWFRPNPSLLAWSVAIVNVPKNGGFVARFMSSGASSQVARIIGVPSRSVTTMHRIPFILFESKSSQSFFTFVLSLFAHFFNSPLKYFFISSVIVSFFIDWSCCCSHPCLNWLFWLFTNVKTESFDRLCYRIEINIHFTKIEMFYLQNVIVLT